MTDEQDRKRIEEAARSFTNKWKKGTDVLVRDVVLEAILWGRENPKPILEDDAKLNVDCEIFYNLMQNYRHTPISDQNGTVEAYQAVLDFISSAAARAHTPKDELVERLVQAAEKLGCGRYGCGSSIGASSTVTMCLECKRELNEALVAFNSGAQEMEKR